MEDNMRGYWLDNFCSIFTGEAIALYHALQLIDPQTPRKYCIYTDSNEQADIVARSATKELPLTVLLCDMKRVIQHRIDNAWKESWNSQTNNKLYCALVEIGGEPKSVKRLRFGDLLIETNSALQTKSFLLAKSFLDCPDSVVPHKSLNSCRGVISESDLLTTTNAEILDGFSGQGVIQPDILTVKFAYTFRILCAVLSSRGSDTLKLPAEDN
ncbi:RNase H domain-containing protein [Trichonephila clavipes]|nr:RNase H domain-containing protein [Trichonephila clavipes]